MKWGKVSLKNERASEFHLPLSLVEPTNKW